MCRHRPSRGGDEVGTEVGTRKLLILRGFLTCPHLSPLSPPMYAWRITLGRVGRGARVTPKGKEEVGTGGDGRKNRDKCFSTNHLHRPHLPRRGGDRWGQGGDAQRVKERRNGED